MPKRARRAFAVASLVGIVNVVAFMVGTYVVGGDAINGESSCPAGPYLWDKTRPDPCHEVSQAVYRYSKIHAYSVIVSLPLFIIGGLWLSRGSFASELGRRLTALPTHKRYQALWELLRRARSAPHTATSDEEMKALLDQTLHDLDSRKEER